MNLSKLDKAISEARETCRVFAKAWTQIAIKMYLKDHKRLPGSNRTKRLRKKRSDAVYKYFSKLLQTAEPGDL
jgi:hypothetical protein